ncbi:tetratricopeptide repeat protein [Flavobacterium jejuense]|uniref:Tetratricopeptide repeat protein n=1 Tax=Flavobacterium jejuense TaxID=1544455 RepID=A0ABX0IZJ7_9FLAO|nr:tetratricopeptide repeat protein [Flavobacterium jejuense]NHN27416.1 tetratricopeptide repeat protein [Flavobacterium jejuense]
MKTKLSLLFAITIGFFTNAQNNEACTETLSLMASSVKAKDPAGYDYLTTLRKDCPSFDKRIYSYGEFAIKQKIDKATGAEKEKYVRDLMSFYEENYKYFPSEGAGVDMKKGLALFNYKLGTNEEKYSLFDKAFTNDKANFDSTRGLYAYFEIFVKDYEAGNKGIELQQVFDKYDDILEKLTALEKEYSDAKDVLIAKEEAGQELDTKEAKVKSRYESNLEDIATVTSSMDGIIVQLSTCDKLIPFYQKSFEQNKTNKVWLLRAADRLEAKECDEDPLFSKISEALLKVDPSAPAYEKQAMVEYQKKNTAKAIEYFNKAAEMYSDNTKKANVYMKIASIYSKSNKSQSRNYARKALAVKPSYGKAYLLIAQLYGGSINDCGKDQFEKRAIYWLAASYCDKAAIADSSLKATASKMAAGYRASAPSKTEIFSHPSGNMSGKRISFNCWVGESITVPSL